MTITTGTHDSSGRTRLHKLLANRKISEGDYLVEYDDEDYEELDDQKLDDLRRSLMALSIKVEWDDMGLCVTSIQESDK